MEAKPPDLPCREDVLIEGGATTPKSCLPSLEMRSPTVAGGLVPTGEASTATETTSNEPLFRFYATEEINPEDDSKTRSTIGGGGRGCNKFDPVLGGNGMKIASTGDIFDQPPGQMRLIRGKLADHVGDHVVLSPEGAVLVTSPGTKSSYPRLPQSVNPSKGEEIMDFNSIHFVRQ